MFGAKTLTRFLFSLAAIIVSTFTAYAQVPTSGNIFFGYSYAGGDTVVRGGPDVQGGSHSAALNGWEGSLEGKFLPWFGIVADLSGHYGSNDVQVCGFILPPCSQVNINARRYTVMFGPQAEVHIGPAGLLRALRRYTSGNRAREAD